MKSYLIFMNLVISFWLNAWLFWEVCRRLVQGKSTLRIYGREADYLPVFGLIIITCMVYRYAGRTLKGLGHLIVQNSWTTTPHLPLLIEATWFAKKSRAWTIASYVSVLIEEIQLIILLWLTMSLSKIRYKKNKQILIMFLIF
jgi:hypothetical protein